MLKKIVWVDKSLCKRTSMCREVCPEAFELDDSDYAQAIGEAVLKEHVALGTEIPIGSVFVRPDLVIAVGQAAEECGGQCIFIKDIDIIESVVSSDPPLQSD